MTAIFGTPLAAILLAIEVLLFEWKPRSFVPVVVSVLVASAWRPLLIGIGPMFPFAGVALEGWWPPFMAAAVGVLFGLKATLLSAALYPLEDLLHRFPVHLMWWPAIGAIIVGIGDVIAPRVPGPGYSRIPSLLYGTL